MIHYNNDNNAYCSAVNAQIFKTREHNTVYISTFCNHYRPTLPKLSIFVYTRILYSYSHSEMFICIYSARSDIYQISTNAFRYTTCCAANVYMFVYILIGALIVPLTTPCLLSNWDLRDNPTWGYGGLAKAKIKAPSLRSIIHTMRLLFTISCLIKCEYF